MALLRRSEDSVKVPRLTLVGMALLVVFGCGEDPPSGATPPPEFELDTQAQWSGGTVTAQSTAFRNLTRLPLIIVDAETLQVSRVDEYNLLIRLPQRPAGTVTLVLHEGLRRDTIGTVRLSGFSEYQTFLPGLQYDPLVGALRNGAPLVLGSGVAGGLVMFAPGTGTVTVVTGLVHHALSEYGIGPTYLAGRFVLRDSTGAIGIWQLWPAVIKVSDWPGPSWNRQHAQLSPTVFLANSSHWTTTLDTVTPAKQYGQFDTESSWGVLLSPRGDRAISRSVSSQPLVPVIDMHTGDTAYSLPQTPNAQGIAFSPDGAILYVAGWEYPQTEDSLRSHDATTGARLAAAPLPGSTIMTMIVNPAGTRLYAMAPGPCEPRLLVYDALTLALIGEAPASSPTPPAPCYPGTFTDVIVMDDALGKLWIVGSGDPFSVFTFEVLP